MGKGFLHQAAFALAAHRDKYDHHVLQRHRQGVFQQVLKHMAALAQPQVVQQNFHDRRVARVADGLVVEVRELAEQALAQGAQAARGVEGLIRHAIQGKLLTLGQRRHLAQHAFNDGFARLAVLVDDAVGAPGQVVVERV